MAPNLVLLIGRGASTWGEPLWALSILMFLPAGLMIRSGSFDLAGIRAVQRWRKPLTYWTLVIGIGLIGLVLAWGALWLDRHTPFSAINFPQQ